MSLQIIQSKFFKMGLNQPGPPCHAPTGWMSRAAARRLRRSAGIFSPYFCTQGGLGPYRVTGLPAVNKTFLSSDEQVTPRTQHVRARDPTRFSGSPSKFAFPPSEAPSAGQSPDWPSVGGQFSWPLNISIEPYRITLIQAWWSRRDSNARPSA